MAGYDVDVPLLTLTLPSYSVHNTNSPRLPPPITSTIPPTTTPAPLIARQNADCSNSIIAAVESATVVVSRSFQQSLATASQELQQASIAALNAIQQASVVSASASSFVAGASAQIASLSSSASVAVANASLSLVAVMESARSVEISASSAVASALAELAAATGSGVATLTATSALTSPKSSSAAPKASQTHKSKLLPSQIALVVIGSMLASVFITLTISLLLLRHKTKVREVQLRKDERGKERASQRPPTSSLPIAVSMNKRAPDKPTASQAPPPAQDRAIHEEQLAQNREPEMTAAIGFVAFHPENEDAFAGALRDRLTRLSTQPSLVPGPQNRVYIPPSPPSPMSVQQAKQVKFSTIRPVESMPAPLSAQEEEFTVSRTVRRYKSKEGAKEKDGARIGVRTWVESDSG